MKKIYPLFLVFLLAGGALAQTTVDSSKSPNIQVIEKSWRVVIPVSPVEDTDPFQANNDAKQSQRDIKENIRQNEIRVRAGLPLQAPPIRVKPIETAPVFDPSAMYLYELKVKNTGEKAIQAIVWEYVFFDKVTKQEVGRRRFTSKVNIAPGKTKNLTMRSVSPPSGTISASQTGKKPRDQYSEEIVIENIEYDDGSIK